MSINWNLYTDLLKLVGKVGFPIAQPPVCRPHQQACYDIKIQT